MTRSLAPCLSDSFQNNRISLQRKCIHLGGANRNDHAVFTGVRSAPAAGSCDTPNGRLERESSGPGWRSTWRRASGHFKDRFFLRSVDDQRSLTWRSKGSYATTKVDCWWLGDRYRATRLGSRPLTTPLESSTCQRSLIAFVSPFRLQGFGYRSHSGQVFGVLRLIRRVLGFPRNFFLSMPRFYATGPLKPTFLSARKDDRPQPGDTSLALLPANRSSGPRSSLEGKAA